MAQVIEAIGESEFYRTILTYVDHLIGADHCAIVAFDREKPVRLGAVSLDGTDIAAQQIDLYLAHYWRLDPAIRAAHQVCRSQSMSLQRLDIDRMPPSGLRDRVYRKAHVSDRLLLYGVSCGCPLSVSVLRSDRHSKFSETDISRFERDAQNLLAAVGRHTNLVTRDRNLSVSLTSLEVILDCIKGASEGLSHREAEVCARILFGMSSLAIGLDLAIGEETVKTYRKRAYQRLNIATQRELLLWYVRLWDAHMLQE